MMHGGLCAFQLQVLQERPIPWHGPQDYHAFFLPGPRKYQMIRPNSGSARISTTHNALFKVGAELYTTLMIAQMSRTNTTSQRNLVIARSSSC